MSNLITCWAKVQLWDIGRGCSLSCVLEVRYGVTRVAFTDNGKLPQTASCRDQIFETIKTFGRLSGSFVDEQAVKGALSALQRGPIRFQRNSVIADNGKSPRTASCRDQIFEAIKAFGSWSKIVRCTALSQAQFQCSKSGHFVSIVWSCLCSCRSSRLWT